MPKNNRFNEVRAQSTLGTQWLWFYVKVLLLINMAGIAIGFILRLPQFFELFRGLDYSLVYKLTLILPLVYYGTSLWLCVKAYLGLLNFTESGYKYNRAFLWVLYCGSNLISLINSDVTIVVVIIGMLGGVPALVLNLIYFKNRKHLYLSLSAEEIAVAEAKVRKAPVNHSAAAPLAQAGVQESVQASAQEKIPYVPKKSRFATVREQSPLGTRWLWFYTWILLLLNMIYSIFNVFGSLLQFFIETNFKLFYILLSLVFYALCFFLALKAQIGILKFSASGYRYNLVYLWLFPIGFIGLQLMVTGLELDFYFLPILAYMVLNLIYFARRRSLFFPAPEVDAEIPLQT